MMSSDERTPTPRNATAVVEIKVSSDVHSPQFTSDIYSPSQPLSEEAQNGSLVQSVIAIDQDLKVCTSSFDRIVCV